MAINYSSPGVPGGEVSPGAGSTGFTSNAIAFTNSSGQLTNSTLLTVLDHATSGRLSVNSTQTPTNTVGSGALTIGTSTAVNMGVGPDRIQTRSSAGAASGLFINPNGGQVTFMTSNSGSKVAFASTLNVTTAVGAAGNAAALPATPEVYLKVLVPNAAGTLTTGYIAVYASTA